MNGFDQGGSTGDNGGCGGDGVGQLKKGPWTASEDAVLAEYVRKHGEGNWNAVQRNTGLARCGKSCRLRWANHLRPNLKKGAFSAEEERLIVELHAQLGNKWARMAAQLPGRTDNEIKNYWNTRVKRRHRQGLPLYPPEIQSPQHGGNHHQRQHHQVHHPYHYHQQQQQQQTSQSPASTPTSSFTFYTSPTTAAHHHHFSSCPTTPNCLSPTTPPPLSPSSALHSPHQHPTLPTLALFDSTATNTSSFSPFNVQRPPPILQNPLPLRFKRFHADTSSAATTTTPTNFNTNYNNNFNTSTYQSSSFSLPLSPFLRSQTSPTSLSTPPFSSDPVQFGYSNTPPSSILRTQFENDYNSPTTTTTNYLSNSPVFSLKPELPSSQMFSHHFVVDNDGDNDQKLSFSGGGSGLLEDLLDESNNHMMNSMEDKRDFSGFNNHWSTDSTSLNLSPGLKPKEEETVAQHQINTTTTTTLFNAFNPTLQLPAEWYLNDTGEASNGHSSVLTDDNIGLELQQIASMFRGLDDSSTQHAPGTTPGSFSLQNLPGP